jgi:cell division protein FtsL
MKTKVAQINKFEKRAFIVLAFAILTLAGFYGYFISKSIINVIVREEISSDVAAINGAISELETKYLEQKNAIGLSLQRVPGSKIWEKRNS